MSYQEINFMNMVVPTVVEYESNNVQLFAEDDLFSLKNKRFYKTTKKLKTIDNVYLPFFDDVNNLEEDEKLMSATDFALINNIEQFKFLDSEDRFTVDFWTGNSQDEDSVINFSADSVEGFYNSWVRENSVGIVPSLSLDINSFLAECKDFIDEILETKITKKGLKHFIKIGEYPKSSVENGLQKTLEELYNNGELKEGLSCTGRLYTTNGQHTKDCNFLSKQNPEFEYNGKKFVRSVVWSNKTRCTFANGDEIPKTGEICWLEVKPITFEITNFDNLPNEINPKGKSENFDKIFTLKAEQAILSGLPFYPNSNHLNCSLWQNCLLRCFLNSKCSDGLDKIKGFTSIYGWDFTKSGFLYQALNLKREATKEYIVPFNEKEIAENAFVGCVGIEKLIIHREVENVGKNAFDGCKFNYAYKIKGDENLVFSLYKPTEEVEFLVDLDKFSRVFPGFDYSLIIKFVNNNLKFINSLHMTILDTNLKYLQSLSNFAEILNKQNLSLPYVFIKELLENGIFQEFYKNSDVRFIKSENDIDLTKQNIYNELSEENKLNYYKFMLVLGCFSKENLYDKSGKPSQVLLAQKANAVLSQILKSGFLKLEDFAKLFENLSIEAKPNQDFLKFISVQGKDKKLNNLKLLIDLDKEYPGLFVEVMTNFNKTKHYRCTLNEKGMPKTVPWDETFKRFFLNKKFNNVSTANQDLAEVFASKGLDVSEFKMASYFRQKAKENKIRPHILDKSLNEMSIVENIEQIKNQTEDLLDEAATDLDLLYTKYFSYEMLSKNDPRNSIMGLYTSCCATIISDNYGSDIATATIIEKDVQNLVVRDSKGEIVSKGTMYVNAKKGYIVINDFELNQRYRKYEIEHSGLYSHDTESQKRCEQERDLIFDTFIRGIHAFVKEWDLQHPTRPIMQVNVGKGYNRLKEQCERYKLVKDVLKVPSEYGFEDAEYEQYVLYKRGEEVGNEIDCESN